MSKVSKTLLPDWSHRTWFGLFVAGPSFTQSHRRGFSNRDTFKTWTPREEWVFLVASCISQHQVMCTGFTLPITRGQAGQLVLLPLHRAQNWSPRRWKDMSSLSSLDQRATELCWLQCVPESPRTLGVPSGNHTVWEREAGSPAGRDFIVIWFGDWSGMAALPTGTGEAAWGTTGWLREEITETYQSRKSVFTPAAKCKMILNCQLRSPGPKDVKSYLSLSVIRSAAWLGGHSTESSVPGAGPPVSRLWERRQRPLACAEPQFPHG